MIGLRIVISVIGIIIQGFAAVMVIPLLSALLVGQYDSAANFLLCTLVSILTGRIAWQCHNEKNFDDLTRVEGIAAVALSWLSVALVGTIQYICSGIGHRQPL
ncbi:MAG: hypothetical protein PHV05_07510 [Candidatus Riflebacteria bacterium]|nr:hypothetical protein [Candidatus Riflebacteria bacterium]